MNYLKLTALDHRLCWQFYNEVYAPAFDNRNYRENPAIWLSLMRPNAVPQVHIILACEQNQTLGGIVFEEYPRTRSWLLTYVAVRPSVQRLGIGRDLINQMLAVVAAGPNYALTFAEVEPAADRLTALHHLGFRLVPFEFVRPSLAEHLAAAPLSLLVYRQRNVMSQRVRAFLADYYSSLNQLESPHLAAMDTRLGDAQIQVWTQPLVDQDYRSASVAACRPSPEFQPASSGG